MIGFLNKYWRVISLVLLFLLLASLFLFPTYTGILSITLLTLSIGSAVVFTVYRHWGVFKGGECTFGRFLQNSILDLLGLALTLGAAMFVGRYTGGYFGLRAGMWWGLIAGFIGGFAAAPVLSPVEGWVMRSVWGKLVRVGV